MAEHLLPRRGTLWTWTTQEFLPKEPYAGGETDGDLPALRRRARPARRRGPGRGPADRGRSRASCDFGMEVELVVVPFRTDDGRHRGRDLRLRSRSEEASRWRTSPSSGSGSTPSAASATSRPSRWAPTPCEPACADAGVEWKDVQFAFGGSCEVDNPDAVVGLLGLTGIPFMDVYNGCATGGHRPRSWRPTPSGSGQYDIGVAVGMDKHPPGAFTADPVDYGAPSWYGETGLLPDHQVLRHEDQPLHARPRHLARDPGQGGGQELPQRRAEPERLPAQADLRGGDPRLADAQLPAHPVHVLRPRRGGGRGRAVPGRHRPPVHRHADLPAGHRPCAPAATAPTRCTAPGPRSSRTSPRPSTPRGPPTRRRASGPRTSTSSSCRTPTPAPRSSTWPRTASAPTASRSS